MPTSGRDPTRREFSAQPKVGLRDARHISDALLTEETGADFIWNLDGRHL